MIDPEHILPLTWQSQILELSRSSLYYKAVATSERDVKLILLIDEIHLKHPYYGIRRIRNELRDLGFSKKTVTQEEPHLLPESKKNKRSKDENHLCELY